MVVKVYSLLGETIKLPPVDLFIIKFASGRLSNSWLYFIVPTLLLLLSFAAKQHFS